MHNEMHHLETAKIDADVENHWAFKLLNNKVANTTSVFRIPHGVQMTTYNRCYALQHLNLGAVIGQA